MDTWRRDPRGDSNRVIWEKPEEGAKQRGPSAADWNKWNNDRYFRPNRGGSSIFRRLITNKFLIQTLVSVLIFMVAIGIYDRQDPASQAASRAMKYLLNVDVNFEPVMGRIVKLVFPEITDGELTPNGGVISTEAPGSGTAKPTGAQGAIGQSGAAGTVPNAPAGASGTSGSSGTLGNPGSAGGTGSSGATGYLGTPKMVLPLDGKIICAFGWVGGGIAGLDRYHAGIDVEAELGSKVHAVLEGEVSEVGEDKALGKYVVLKHSGDQVTLYAQLDKILVSEKQVVKGGEIIGLVGRSGDAEKPHLHFEFREKGQAVDPYAKLKQGGI